MKIEAIDTQRMRKNRSFKYGVRKKRGAGGLGDDREYFKIEKSKANTTSLRDIEIKI